MKQVVEMLIIFALVQGIPFLCMSITKRFLYRLMNEPYEYPQGYKTMYMLMLGVPIVGAVVSLIELGNIIIELKDIIKERHTLKN